MKIATVCIGFMLMAATSFASGKEAILGQWRTEGEKSRVEIASCNDGKLCGKIVWLKEPVYTDSTEGPLGAAKTDRNNPDQGKRSQMVIGLKIMDGFTPTGDNVWENGTIYDPENGKTYKCKVRQVAPDRLEVRGFIGISFLGRTTVWVR